jgi:subtilisin family serine protease
MTKRHLLRAVVIFIVSLGFVPQSVNSQVPAPAVRVLVKVRSLLANDIESALPVTDMALLPGQSLNGNVEAFLSRHSARRMAPLYPQIVRVKKATGLLDTEIATGVRQTYARRASRLRAAFQPPEISRTYVLELDGALRGRLAEILNNLRADPDVEFAEEDKIVSANFSPNDPYFLSSGSWGQTYDDLWGIKKIGAPAAWDTSTGTGVIVAVVDTGIDYSHPDIVNNIWSNTKEIVGNGIDDDHNGYIDDVRGWDFIGPSVTNPQQSNDPIDHQGHGTHVAGIIAAEGNNGIGIIGVAWHAQVMAVKGLDDQGIGLDSTLAPAIMYAANNGADVISASWGGPGYSQTIADAVSYAYNLGAVFVAAAGNNGGDARDFYPAALWNVITVAASDSNDNLASFSNSGSKIDVAAPGVDILSLQASGTNLGITVSPGYTRASGTSMATPHVSGLAALILSQNANYSNEDVRQVLRASATDLGTPGYDLSFGYGRINAAAALSVSSVLEAKISSPVDGIVTQSVLTISGVARGTGFSNYILEYGAGTLPSSWTTIQTGTTPVSGTLGVFDTTVLADGLYDVRLRAFNTSGQAFTDRIQVVVHTVFIISPAPPSAPTSSTTFKNGVVIPILGTAVGGSFQNFQVDWAPGLDPSSGWQTTGVTLTGGGLLPITSGLLANWDTSSIVSAGYYTIRLTSHSASTSQALTMVYFEPDLISANWPQLLDQGPYFSAGTVPTLNRDGSIRLVVEGPANGPGAGELWTLSQNGPLQQVFLPGLGSFQQPAVADLDGNPGEETVVADSGGIEAVRLDSTIYPLTSSKTLDYQRSQIVIEDLAGDSHWETLALGSDYNAQLGYVSAWRADGTLLNNNFPIQIADQNPLNTRYNRTRLLVGDVDGDGKKEIVVQEGLSQSTFTLRLFANDGTPRTWNVPVLSGLAEAMVAADLDHNSKLETILVSYSGSNAILNVFQPDGTERAGWPLALPNPNQDSQSFLAVGDLNQDGHEEIVYSHETYLYVFKDDGTLFSNAWPLQAGPIGYASVVIGDVDGDGFPEIVTTLHSILSTPDPFFKFGSRYYDEQLLAIRRDATIARSWQLTGRSGYDLYVYPAPAIGDFNQDGTADIAVAYEVTGSPTAVPGIVTMVSTGAKFNPALNDWPLVRHDPRNTSVLQNPSAYTSSSTATLTASANPSVFGQQVTFTAIVAPQPNLSGANTPTGQVNILDGGANLGSCTLATGGCKFATSSLATGTHAITATYMGDLHFTISTSPGLSQVVVAPDFSLSVSSAQPVSAGSPAVYMITVSPLPSPFIYAVTNFNCTGLPTGTACSVKPASVTPNNGSVTTMLTISTTSRTLALASPSNESHRLLFAVWLSTGMLGLFSIVAMSDKRQRHAMRLWLALALLGSALAMGCATGSQGNSSPPPNPNGTPAGTYSVTLSASSNGNTNHSTTVVLKVN